MLWRLLLRWGEKFREPVPSGYWIWEFFTSTKRVSPLPNVTGFYGLSAIAAYNFK
jgi:hypothetical protein